MPTSKRSGLKKREIELDGLEKSPSHDRFLSELPKLFLVAAETRSNRVCEGRTFKRAEVLAQALL
jgi:hypothetical protein